MSAFAASSFSLATRVRSATDCAGAKKLETRASTTKMAHTCVRLVTHSSSRTSTPRIRSLEIITRFTRQRSTKTPEIGLTTASGSIYAINR
jgi:hypothetical protein